MEMTVFHPVVNVLVALILIIILFLTFISKLLKALVVTPLEDQIQNGRLKKLKIACLD